MWIMSYWMLPVIAAAMWAATLITMLVRWSIDGFPHYPSMEDWQRIAYISDVGAQGLKPLFIIGSSVTGAFFTLSFAAERWLRHRGHLLPNKGRLDKVLAILAMLFCILGTAGLVLLAVFDTLRHDRLHDGFLVLFMGGFLLSAVFVCAEYYRLGIHYREHRIITISFWLKLAFILIELALSIAFGVSMRRRQQNRAAVLEWVIAFIFTFYILSFIIDLIPAARKRKHVTKGMPPVAEVGKTRTGSHVPSSSVASSVPHHQRNSDMRYEEPVTRDSTGPSANTYRGYTVQSRV